MGKVTGRYPITFDAAERESSSLCHFCPKLCRHLCPVSNAFTCETFTPGAKNSALKLLVENELPPSDDTLSVMYACTGCRRCTKFCLHSVDVPMLLFKGRAMLAGEGFIHPRLTHIRTSYARSGNLYDKKTVEILASLVPQELRYDPAAEGATLVFFSADEILFNPSLIQSALKLLDLFADRLFKVFTGPESCSALPLLWSGNYEDFLDHARRLIAAFNKAALVVSPSASFIAALREIYPKKGFVNAPETLHLSEYIAPVAAKGNVGFEKYSGEVWYYDSPLLANYAGVMEAPRRLLKAVCECEHKEFSRNRAECFSAGAEGLIELTMPEESEIMKREILDEIESDGAIIVTASEKARIALSQNERGIKVVNLFDFLAERTIAGTQ
ncbi:MAG: hypothetical protein Kow0090_05480 [Myxococcota bacterium]